MAGSDSARRSRTVEVKFKDGSTARKHVKRAIGSHDVPLTSEAIDRKFIGQSQTVIGNEAATLLLALAWKTPELEDMSAIAKASVHNQ